MPGMASVHRAILIEAGPQHVWSAVRAVGQEHRLFAGVVVDSHRDGDHRVVTFASGAVVRELIVTVDDDRRRLVYAVVESPFDAVHHQASLQVAPVGDGRTRLVWITDVVPDELAAPIGAVMDLGVDALRRTLTASPDPPPTSRSGVSPRQTNHPPIGPRTSISSPTSTTSCRKLDTSPPSRRSTVSSISSQDQVVGCSTSPSTRNVQVSVGMSGVTSALSTGQSPPASY